MTAGSDKTIRLWNPRIIDPAQPPSTSTFLSDNGNNNLQNVLVDNLPRALPIQKYEFRHAATALSVDKPSKHLLVGSNKATILLDCITGKVLRQWHGHTSTVQSVDLFSSKEHGPEILASASYDATVCLWDSRSNNPRPLQTLKDAKDAISVVQFDSNAAAIYTTSIDGCFRVYDLRQGRLVCNDCHSPLTHMAVSNSGRRVALSGLDGAIRMVRQPVATTNGSTFPPTQVYRQGHTAGRYGLECSFLLGDSHSMDGDLLVSGSEDGRVVVYGRGGAAVADLVGHTAPTCSVVGMSDADGMVISASYDGHCIIWAHRHDVMRWGD